MDTPTIEKYYKEHDPMKRKALLDEAIQSGEDAEANAVRKELWDVRYQSSAELGEKTRADGYLALWMVMEFNRDVSKKFFGYKRARKEITKNLETLRFKEFEEKSPLHKELLYRECYHMIKMYVELCRKDKSYNSALCGILTISSENVEKKMKNDVYETAIELPSAIQMEEELKVITDAAKEVLDEFFPE